MSSEIKERAKAKMAGILAVMDTADPDCGLKAIDRMLDEIQEIAIVDREAELPENPFDKTYHTPEEKVRWIIHNNAQQDMLKWGAVKEVK